MAITEQLYHLQELDTDIEAHQHSLQQKESLIGANQQLVRAESSLSSKQAVLEELKGKQQAFEWEINELDEKVKAAEGKLYGGTINNPKELSSLQQDINMLKEQRDRAETGALETIDEVEAAEAAVVSARGALAKAKEEYEAQQAKLRTEIEQLKAELAQLQNDRSQVAATIDELTLATYDRLRKAKGQAVAKVEQGICRVCRISLSSSELQQARSGATVHCGSCGRILYLP